MYILNMSIHTIGESHLPSCDDDGQAEQNTSCLDDAGQLMISSREFISMGVGEGGASGLRLNEDLTRGSTSKSMCENDVLVAEGIEVFDIGLGTCNNRSICTVCSCWFYILISLLPYLPTISRSLQVHSRC